MEVRPHVRTALATRLADELRLNIREPYMIRPPIGGQVSGVATAVVAAEDIDPKDAGLAHFSEGDLLLSGHALF